MEEASRVGFTPMLAAWVDNFLYFPAGTPVPIGYYDEDRNAWHTARNGVVVRLVDTDSDGIVDDIDAGGSSYILDGLIVRERHGVGSFGVTDVDDVVRIIVDSPERKAADGVSAAEDGYAPSRFRSDLF